VSILNAQGITKVYKRRRGATVTALCDVSITIEAGQCVAVQGPSGSGKSTLLLAAGGLLHPDAGRILVQDTDVYTLSPEQRAIFRARNIGFVFQQFHLIPFLSVLENVLTPSLAAPGDDLRARAGTLLPGSASNIAAAICLRNSARVSASEPPWLVRCCTVRNCCWPTNRRVTWMRKMPRSSLSI